ncbi:hypothetical protein MLD38_028056 [Melastoma candidum]|uniref:Uncharacterized protein n=1 Tax=Melastoma candidum TaxID=119954 RepID=A0ACB9N449_9MYRT|nr:hypothetical protein MLD38_028056 [Melastoma candidum]
MEKSFLRFLSGDYEGSSLFLDSVIFYPSTTAFLPSWTTMITRRGLWTGGYADGWTGRHSWTRPMKRSLMLYKANCP